ncbi:PREDICTED: T-cell surface glycoprotein CD3 epsilon chain [Chrysochloris asiatica]|uniref:T-cell surface glycoprotein CD3 epsilon chain n=1 Tax=Chrysochloris asiatica TaxID=185453 RepID=A0A9B0WHQ5_CHRAS|nr:PREDICTED: T-cell surface glycoprotein CD3 epsilon chain [Chrysochloris asiatica]
MIMPVESKVVSLLARTSLIRSAWVQSENEETDESTKKYEISISGTNVVLKCPEESSEHGGIKWLKNDKPLDSNEQQLKLENFSEMENSGYYSCYVNQEKKHHLYLKARVCENCMEVNLKAIVGIVIADICITLGLLLLVYYWSKNRKAKAKPVMRGTAGTGNRPRGPKKERPPPVPNPDYEPIRKGQQDLYAGLNQRNV